MTNYEQMSDFEINKRVCFHALGGMFEVLVNHCMPDYCNSWADAGPIIGEYGISLEYDHDEWCAKAGNAAIGENGDHLHYCWSKDPLRAAMICFLMMKEAEKNQDRIDADDETMRMVNEHFEDE